MGFLLLWSNTQMQSARPIGTGTKQIKKPSQLVVDGQQRLTSLYAVFRGASVVDEDFRESKIEIAFRPRDGRFDVVDAAIRRDPEYIPNISAMWETNGSEYLFVGKYLEHLRQAKELTQDDETIISTNISRLQNLINYQLTALVVHADVQEDAVADIFVRINSQGVKLDQSDFILTMLSVVWPEGRKQLEEFAKAARQPPAIGNVPSPFNYLIQPGADQMMKAIIGLGFHRGRLKAVYQVLRGRDPETGNFDPALREAQFAKLREAQPKALNLNDWHAYLQTIRSAGFLGRDTISSENSLIYTYALYLLGKHQCGVKEPELGRLIRRWFFTVTLSARYSGSSESTMDGDLGDLRDATSGQAFADSLERKIQTTLTGDFWNVSLPAALETSSAQAPQMLAFRAAQAVLFAPVLFSDKKVRDLLDPSMRPPTKALEQHHLFPKAWLKRHGVTTSKRINQVANLTLLEWPQNRDLSDLSPKEYVPRLKPLFPAAQWEHMLHMHAMPPAWEAMEYEHFLEARRVLMARIIRQAYESLSKSTDNSGELTLADATADERSVWPAVEQLERRLRAVVRAQYEEEWGAGSEGQMRAALGKQLLEGIDRNREKHHAA